MKTSIERLTDLINRLDALDKRIDALSDRDDKLKRSKANTFMKPLIISFFILCAIVLGHLIYQAYQVKSEHDRLIEEICIPYHGKMEGCYYPQ